MPDAAVLDGRDVLKLKATKQNVHFVGSQTFKRHKKQRHHYTDKSGHLLFLFINKVSVIDPRENDIFSIYFSMLMHEAAYRFLNQKCAGLEFVFT
jgi:hypothetical protein